MLAAEPKNRAIFARLLNIVILFTLLLSLFVYRRHGTVGSLSPVHSAVCKRNLALLWSRQFSSPRGHSLEQRLGCLCHPGCQAIPRLQFWLSPMPGRVPVGTRPTPPPLQSCGCCVCSPLFPWELDLWGGKGRGWSLCLPCGMWTWRHRLGSRPLPPHFIPLRCHDGVGGALKEAEQLVMLYAYRLWRGPWNLETGVPGRQGVAEGQLDGHGVLPITRVRGWGDRMEAHMDHAWLMMLSHAQGETRVHSGELGAVVVGDDDDNGGDT